MSSKSAREAARLSLSPIVIEMLLARDIGGNTLIAYATYESGRLFFSEATTHVYTPSPRSAHAATRYSRGNIRPSRELWFHPDEVLERWLLRVYSPCLGGSDDDPELMVETASTAGCSVSAMDSTIADQCQDYVHPGPISFFQPDYPTSPDSSRSHERITVTSATLCGKDEALSLHESANRKSF